MYVSIEYYRNMPSDTTPPQRRELNDPVTLRALTHPVRLALLDALETAGTLTATQASELIGEPPNTCSFHFRQLAKYGFVEETGEGTGRNRPWRKVTMDVEFTDMHADGETRQAARALDRMLREHYWRRLEQFYATRADYPAEWQAVTGGSQQIVYVSPDELRTLGEAVHALLDRYHVRVENADARPPDAIPIEVLLFAYPAERPGGTR